MTDTSSVSQSTAQPTQRIKAGPNQTSFLGRLSVGQKLALAGSVLGLPFAWLAIQNVVEANRKVAQIEQEIQGQQLIDALRVSQNNTQFVRLSSTNLLSGNAAGAQDLATQRQSVQTSLQTVIDRSQSLELTDIQQAAQSALNRFNELASQVDEGAISAAQAQQAYTELLNNVITPLYGTIAKDTMLELSENLEVAELVNLVTTVLPQEGPQAGSIGSGTVTVLNKLGETREVNETAAIESQLRWDNANASQQRIEQALAEALTTSPALDRQLRPAYTDLVDAGDAIFGTVRTGLVDAEVAQITPSDVQALIPDYAAALFGSFEQATTALGTTLEQEAQQSRTQALLTALLTALGLATAAGLLHFISRSITNPLTQLTGAARNLSQGNLGARVPVTTQDELGTLSQTFNLAATQLEANERRAEQERLEQERLQNNIGQFLDVTMDIAEGDLTKRGVVTEDVLGNVVDSINLMTEELGYVLGDIQKASGSVTSGSQAVLATTSQIQEGTAMTAAEAQRVTQQVQELSASIRQMAEQAQASADAARQALLASQQGQEAVTGTLDGMQNIRREVQGVAKSIKGLGDRSLEIQEIVDTISSIARQTNLLALNATIEAAGAGEAGGRFSIVADEVRKLADNSAAATGRIATLIQNIQSEIQDVVVNVEESTREVEQGYRVAGTAGERLRQIGDLTQQSAQLAENISSATQQQVQGIEQMGSAVQQIAQIAQQSEQSVQQGRAAADQLQRLADQLNASLSRFRLPN
ncbi:methyl-accepting chemotaxis protein [Deinococcus radiophilus]|uniref:methyl-accepting chemotaxis protein n=1 Tax=Deinococcus radiophilus TaxID=32062 RepID=UPI001E3BB1DD|nr:methyl-accepting chemotaxis protein [Deinococcus radiophilus]UFA51535.1 methyl-accepting chemotaxis protein [Deinococcus radiophilus]